MRDAKGRLIELWDFIKAKPLNHDRFVAGRVSSIVDGNLSVRWLGVGQVDEGFFDPREAILLLKADGEQVGTGV